MPGFDGTGPRGEGPLTGRAEGYCAMQLPDKPGQTASGYAGLQGTPVRMPYPAVRPALRARFARWIRPLSWPGRLFRPRRGFVRGRGRRRGW